MIKKDAVAHIAVCICTRKRPVMLERIIRCYAGLIVPPFTKLSLVIVENDILPACKALVSRLSERLEIAIHYRHEPRIGIPYARNKALDAADEIAATHLAFVDDDEWFDPNWLSEFWRYRETLSDEAVLQGPVISVLPPDTPAYYAQFYYTGRHKTGTMLKNSATCNVLIPLEPIRKHALRFDEIRPLAGGEDTIFFHRAHQAGIPMLACEEAQVYEEVPAERARLAWLLKRNFRVGATWGNCQKEIFHRSAIIVVASQLPNLIVRLVKVLVFAVSFRQKELIGPLLGVAKISGRMLGSVGFQIDMYKKMN